MLDHKEPPGAPNPGWVCVAIGDGLIPLSVAAIATMRILGGH
jgi:hypothetical protein